MLANIANKGITSTEFWALMAGIAAIVELEAPPWPIAVMVGTYMLGRSLVKAWGPASAQGDDS